MTKNTSTKTATTEAAAAATRVDPVESITASVEREIARIAAKRETQERRIAKIQADAIAPLNAELAKLRGVHNRLTGTRAGQTGPGRPSFRPAQYLAIVAETPDLGVAEIAKRMGVSTNQAYKLRQTLADTGKLTKNTDGTYSVVGE